MIWPHIRYTRSVLYYYNVIVTIIYYQQIINDFSIICVIIINIVDLLHKSINALHPTPRYDDDVDSNYLIRIIIIPYVVVTITTR